MFVSEPHTPEQLEAIALSSYIEDIQRCLDNREYEINGDIIAREPSPPPEYDRYGKRTNTREQRIIKQLETELTLAVYRALEIIPNYVPPSNFTKLTRSTEKYYLPVREHPHINFVGLLLGPRGNNLRRMETESGAKISIRGRGSVKESGRASTQSSSDEDLHCAVTAISPDSIKKAFDLIAQVVNTAIETPEHQNDFKRLQLRQLAELNGTLRDFENQLCSICHKPGHRKYACPQRQAVQNDRDVTPNKSRASDGFKARNYDVKDAVEDFLTDIGDSHMGEAGEQDATNPLKRDENVSNDSRSSSEETISTNGYRSDATTGIVDERKLDMQVSLPPGPPGVDNDDSSLPIAPPGLTAISNSTAPPKPPPGFQLPPPPVNWKPS